MRLTIPLFCLSAWLVAGALCLLEVIGLTTFALASMACVALSLVHFATRAVRWLTKKD